MSRATTGTGLGLVCLAAASTLYFSAVAQEPKGADKKVDEKATSIVGTWTNSVRHAVHNHLYQPVQGARDRDESIVYFEQRGDRLIGYSLSSGHEQEDWNKEGRTEFRDVKFVKGRLSFEFDIEMNHGRRHQTKSKAWIRVEAELKDNRLIGKWRIFEKATGDELFRGEWEAWRVKEPPKK